MKKLNVAVIGYGNVGKHAVEAVREASDMLLAGVVRRDTCRTQPAELAGIKVTDDVFKLDGVDAALLCVPTRNVPETAEGLLSRGIHTVDCFDIHADIPALRQRLSAAARAGGAVAVVAAAWDPGGDSAVRALMEAAAPRGVTYTDFGPGMSMGHSVAVRAIEGVADAMSVTLPLGAGVHRRMVYVQLEEGADIDSIAANIKSDPYFAGDETHVAAVPDVAALKDMGHGVRIERRGGYGRTHNQWLEFSMRINNPALTAQIMTACARAASRQMPGAYTFIELPPVDLLPGEREHWIKRLV